MKSESLIHEHPTIGEVVHKDVALHYEIYEQVQNDDLDSEVNEFMDNLIAGKESIHPGLSINTSKRGRKPIPFSDWVTVEKRRASEGVYAFYVRCKNENGELKVGLVDYMKVSDFDKYFANNDSAYQAYRQQLMTVFKMQRKENKLNELST